MRNRKQKIKYILLLCVFSMFLIASCKRSETGKTVESKEVINAQWENAAHTPYGKYPELVTYTLGKIVGSNNANLPVKATYEDNAYTRYLKERLNIQNEDSMEAEQIKALYDICHAYEITTKVPNMKFIHVIAEDGTITQKAPYTDKGARVFLYAKTDRLVIS